MCVIHIKILQLEPNSNVTATAAPLTSSLPYSTPQIINRSSVIPQTLVQPGSHLSQPGRRYPWPTSLHTYPITLWAWAGGGARMHICACTHAWVSGRLLGSSSAKRVWVDIDKVHWVASRLGLFPAGFWPRYRCHSRSPPRLLHPTPLHPPCIYIVLQLVWASTTGAVG